MVNDYEKFKKDIFSLTQIDLSSYKERQMKRRIDTLIQRHKINGYDEFVKSIKTDQKLFDDFVAYLTINVSEFYRNPEQWEMLDKDVFPSLIKKFGKKLTIWSAACSTGDEPYSLVMALSKHVPLDNIKIIATDIDKQILEKAKVGLYNEKSIVAVPADLKKKYFEKVGASYKISDDIKKRVEFREHNLLKDSYPKSCHMIVCRNVVIYFTDEAKDEVYRKFYDSLVSGGVLFIGNTEQITDYKKFGYVRSESFIYLKE